MSIEFNRDNIARLMGISLDDVPNDLETALKVLADMCWVYKRNKLYVNGFRWNDCWHIPSDRRCFFEEGSHILLIIEDEIKINGIVQDGKWPT